MKNYPEEHMSNESLLMTKLVTDYKWIIIGKIVSYLSYTNDAVEDIFGDVVLHISEKIKKHMFKERETGSFKSWVCCLTTNYLISKYCRGKRSARLLGEEDLESIHEYECICEGRTLSAQERERKLKTLEAFLRSLPESQVLLIEMRIYKELTYREIAEIRKLPLSTVSSQIQTSYKILRKKMETKGYRDSFI